MIKLPNIFKTSAVVISQGLHIQTWGTENYFTAIDFAYIDNLICPFDNCEIVTYSNSFPANTRQSYFSLKLPDGNHILIVHAKPVKNGKIMKGEPFAYCTWHHYHLSMLINGKPEPILDYLDRNISLSSASHLYGTTNHPDAQWSTYSDKYLNIEGETTQSPKPDQTLETRTVNNRKEYKTLIGGWVWSVINEMIQFNLLEGEWSQYEERIRRLNPLPQGGYKVGQWLAYEEIIEAPQEPQKGEDTLVTPVVIDKAQASQVIPIPDPESFKVGYESAMNDNLDVIQLGEKVSNTAVDNDMEVEEVLGLISEGRDFFNKGIEEKWSLSKWILGVSQFGIDKWVLITSLLSGAGAFLDQYIEEKYYPYFYGYLAIASLGILFFFLANKVVGKLKQ